MEIVPRIFNFTVINWIDALTSDRRLSLEKPDVFLDQICLHIGICAELYNMSICSRILIESFLRSFEDRCIYR